MKDISQLEGSMAEKLFIKTAIGKEFSFVRKATKQEDMDNHWDILLKDKNDIPFTLDIKAHKHLYRNGPLLKDWYYIEWKNVNGDKGWIHGDAKYIAFQYFNKFYIYDRCKLRDAASRLTNFNETVEKSSQAKYKIYSRKNRKDQISMIKIFDLNSSVSPEAIWTIPEQFLNHSCI